MLSKNVALLVLVIGVASASLASVEVPLPWHTVSISSSERGGAELTVSLTESRQLDKISLKIRDKDVDIPDRCLEGLFNPYLNGLKIRYGQFHSGEEYWTVEIPFDGTGSVELESKFTLVFSETRLLWADQSIQIDDSAWEDRNVCRQTPARSLESD
ncbi:MAG: hypothetical protein QNJ19_05685 [Woeseiaceae bacterium]|nr:hypothetical protein [Woeseiaceae bacterium]